MSEKLISVIVPAYNVENYIRRCLDSLVSQTYGNLEIIVVNDGSTDRTGEIIEEYTERYPDKVMLYTRENQGQAEARNFGISKASGEYIGFVDSDDFVSTKMYELMYREAEEQNCDMVTCGYYGCDEVTGEITVYQTGYKGEFNQSIYENPMLLRINSPYPWNKLYTRELLERSGFSFRKGIIFEDLCAIFPLFMDARKVGRVHEKLYYYIKGRKGGTISTFNEKHGQIIDALQIMNDAYQHRGMFERFYDTLLFSTSVIFMPALTRCIIMMISFLSGNLKNVPLRFWISISRGGGIQKSMQSWRKQKKEREKRGRAQKRQLKKETERMLAGKQVRKKKRKGMCLLGRRPGKNRRT